MEIREIMQQEANSVANMVIESGVLAADGTAAINVRQSIEQTLQAHCFKLWVALLEIGIAGEDAARLCGFFWFVFDQTIAAWIERCSSIGPMN
ncbi:hypothetical protein [Gellertiella hungarica]|uniref:Uncharacterized protein n=1 Tax=Gellertiella hungarica TaxID=1572859 RepID=A0A7W6NKW9_9HYPH|nr:hypothetical protein [Gellertiella hungarica]MBB4064732.1 hypothetical protein [Gellertiella hungarica]